MTFTSPDAAGPAAAFDIRVRDADDADMAAVTAIYEPQVRAGFASFEMTPPTVEEMRGRLASVRALGLPYLVAERQGVILGYAYAGPYRARPAYRDTIENSVYVAAEAQGQGVGRALLAELIARCERGPWRQMIAVIGDSANSGSIALHASLGFRHVGTFEAVGFKLGRWLDTVMMQRALGPGADTPPAPRVGGT
ncbi:GNAT family N-acetyltransferase [Hansschlegelia sp. KR7-227]|uniref:GNAT family N-acetyltransferase n=1 Tax=Hansschlegelia sp. KR7-227 TaxID=3400914 RepID=UPI003C024CFB